MPFTNRLIHETSPYLLQHAHNPVDWYPWGPEAIEKARRENKPIFLSVGYSTCYWCHVMERQSFENEQIAKEMNDRFINIKVDREERPDVDQLYMTAVQVMTRQGGWPMSVFMTPALEPFYAGTYFPPRDGYGRPGFPRLVAMLEEAYRQRPQDVKQTTDQLRGILKQMAEPRRPSRAVTLDAAAIDEIIDRSVSDFDPVHGGFGGSPKFPRQTLLQLLLVHHSLRPNEARMKMLTRTLEALANGGIRDHLGGGFHRYSTDAEWLVPHFEIMLYDNAMLGWVYAEAFRQTGEGRYAKVARGIFDFVLREMTSPEGAFYTAFDAEVDSMEGVNYLWTKEEIEEVLAGMDVPLFLRVYGVDRGPNFGDPHHGTGTPDRNILYLPKSLEQVAAEMKISVEELDGRLAPMRQALYTARMKRKQPLLDTKVLTGWNALMIRAMAHGGRVLNEPRYLQAAERSATFLLERHRDSAGQLYRTSRAGSEPKFAAFLDDYAFLADALLELAWKEKAAEIADAMVREFAGERGGFYFSSTSATDLIVRQMVGTDSPLPSGNGVAAKVMLELGRTDVARDTLAAFAQAMDDHGEGMSTLVEAAARYVESERPLVVEASEATSVERSATPQDLAASVVSVQGAWKDPRELQLELTIEDGFHIQAHDAGAGLIATMLAAPVGAVVQYPAGVEREFDFSETPVRVYDGSVTIEVRFATPPSGPVKLGLTYQACDEGACLPKVTKMIEVSL
jgi:uncharacterized protein YyaL (SSP411 family)